jgi:hypothetical protein
VQVGCPEALAAHSAALPERATPGPGTLFGAAQDDRHVCQPLRCVLLFLDARPRILAVEDDQHPWTPMTMGAVVVDDGARRA